MHTPCFLYPFTCEGWSGPAQRCQGPLLGAQYIELIQESGCFLLGPGLSLGWKRDCQSRERRTQDPQEVTAQSLVATGTHRIWSATLNMWGLWGPLRDPSHHQLRPQESLHHQGCSWPSTLFLVRLDARDMAHSSS